MAGGKRGEINAGGRSLNAPGEIAANPNWNIGGNMPNATINPAKIITAASVCGQRGMNALARGCLIAAQAVNATGLNAYYCDKRQA